MSEIIIGVDGTERGEDAVVFGRQLAAFTGARIVLANAFPYEDVRSRTTSRAYREALREASQEMLDAITERYGMQARTCPVASMHDASNAIAAPVATRAMHPLQAAAVAAVFNLLGPIPLGAAVANTVAGIVTVSPDEVIAVIGAGLAAAVAWNLIT